MTEVSRGITEMCDVMRCVSCCPSEQIPIHDMYIVLAFVLSLVIAFLLAAIWNRILIRPNEVDD